jgi:hypothetical protein
MSLLFIIFYIFCYFYLFLSCFSINYSFLFIYYIINNITNIFEDYSDNVMSPIIENNDLIFNNYINTYSFFNIFHIFHILYDYSCLNLKTINTTIYYYISYYNSYLNTNCYIYFINKNKDIQNNICFICLDNNDSTIILQNNKIYSFTCKCNVYCHYQCLDNWFQIQLTKNNLSCPICRSNVYLNINYYEIFIYPVYISLYFTINCFQIGIQIYTLCSIGYFLLTIFTFFISFETL